MSDVKGCRHLEKAKHVTEVADFVIKLRRESILTESCDRTGKHESVSATVKRSNRYRSEERTTLKIWRRLATACWIRSVVVESPAEPDVDGQFASTAQSDG
jgi:hypothetical protein